MTSGRGARPLAFSCYNELLCKERADGCDPRYRGELGPGTAAGLRRVPAARAERGWQAGVQHAAHMPSMKGVLRARVGARYHLSWRAGMSPG